jgi:hypothetical protein
MSDAYFNVVIQEIAILISLVVECKPYIIRNFLQYLVTSYVRSTYDNKQYEEGPARNSLIRTCIEHSSIKCVEMYSGKNVPNVDLYALKFFTVPF